MLKKVHMPPALGAAVIGFGWCFAGGARKETSGLEVYVDIQFFLANEKPWPETYQGLCKPSAAANNSASTGSFPSRKKCWF